MRTEAFRTANIYRHLLKAVKKHIGKEENKRHFLEYVTSEFHKNRNLSDGVAVQHKIKLARDYTYLLNNLHYHKVLSNSGFIVISLQTSLLLCRPVLYIIPNGQIINPFSLKLTEISTDSVIVCILQNKSKM